MAQAEIGALRVTLALNAGEFTRGLSKAEANLARFGARVERVAKAAAVAFTAISAAGVAALGALSVAVKGAIDDADRMAKLSQQVGVPVEQLSRLRLAADLSGTSMEQLANGIGRLSRNMADLAAGSGEEARRAFQALRIEVQNGDGSLRSSSAVMADVADRFSRMEDGAAKTAFAMQIFGRAGREMIPLLNGGAQGLADMEREADQLGLTIDANTAKRAEIFNDNLTRLTTVAKGFVTQLAARLLPVLQRFSEHVINAAKSGQFLGTVSDGLVKVMRFIASTVAEGVLFFSRMRAELSALGEAFKLFAQGEFLQGFSRIGEAGAETERQFASLRTTLDDIFTGATVDAVEFSQTMTSQVFEPVIVSTKALATARREQAAADREAKAIIESSLSPMEALAAEQARLNQLFDNGRKHSQAWAIAQRQAVGIAANAYLGLASQAAGALGALFGESKAFAIAQAVINTAQAVTQTLAQYGATPWGLAAAAVAAAAGAAQVAAIRRTSKGSGGGGSGGSVPSTQAAAPAAAQSSTPTVTTISLTGDLFGRDQVARLIEKINEAVGDGHSLRTA